MDDEAVATEADSMIRQIDDDDVTVGRMNGGLDPSEFDFLPKNSEEFDATDAGYLIGWDPTWDARSPREAEVMRQNSEDEMTIFSGEEPPDERAQFRSPGPERFPILKAAIRHFQRAAKQPRAVRIDTHETYLGFASEQVLREIDRRLCELRDRVERHESDGHGGDVDEPPMRKWEVLGAMRAVEDLRNSTSAREAVEKLEQVPLDLPGYARGKVHCWQDGDCVVCSLHFAAADGSHRVATAAARPSVDADEAAEAALKAGVDPVTVLGALSDVAAVVVGTRLVRDVAGAALKARGRREVLDAAEPVVVVKRGDADRAPLAAIMHLQQRAEAGDAGAAREMRLLRRAARGTASGRRFAAPVLREAAHRLNQGRQKKALGSRLMSAYARAAGWV